MPSNSTELFGLIAFFAFAALVIHSLWQASKRLPPATDRLPAGVDGALLAVAGLAFLAGIYDAAAAALAYQQIGEGGAWAADHALEVDFAAQFALNAFGAAAFFWAAQLRRRFPCFFCRGRSARIGSAGTRSFVLDLSLPFG